MTIEPNPPPDTPHTVTIALPKPGKKTKEGLRVFAFIFSLLMSALTIIYAGIWIYTSLPSIIVVVYVVFWIAVIFSLIMIDDD